MINYFWGLLSDSCQTDALNTSSELGKIYHQDKHLRRLSGDRAWFVRMYGEISPSFSEGIIDRKGAQTMLYLTCTIIFSVDLAHYGVSRVNDWVYKL